MGGVKPPHLGGCNIQRGFHPHIWGAAPHGGGFTLQRAFCPPGGLLLSHLWGFPPVFGGAVVLQGGLSPSGGGFTPVCGAVGDFTPHMGALHLVGGFTPYVWGFPFSPPPEGHLTP